MFIAQYIYNFARQTPTSPAIIHNGESISYGAFANAVTRSRAEISSFNFLPVGTVAIQIRDLLDCWVVTLALQAQGYTTICVRALELLESLEVKNLVAIFVSAGEEGMLTSHTLAPVFAVSQVDVEGAKPLPSPPLAENVDDCGHILYTSGTTGKYKKVFVPALTQRAADQERCYFQAYDSSTRYNSLAFGLWTGNGYKAPASVWSVGGTAIFEQRADWAESFLLSGVTRATLLPDQALKVSECESLVIAPPASDARPIISVSGGFVSARVTAQLSRAFKLINSYGCTEVSLGILYHDYDVPGDPTCMASTGTRVIEVESESGGISAINEEGLLRVKLTELDAEGYMDDLQSSREAFRGGYFYPGDLAVQLEDGKFRILGRATDVVNLAGQKLAVAPIEANLQSMLQLDYVCLFAGVDAAGEPEAVIAMEAAEMPSKDRLDQIGHEFSQWGEVRFALVEVFPRTQSGTSKIDRKRLRRLLFAD